MPGLSGAEFNLVSNAFSFGIAAMGAATAFLWLQRGSVASAYRLALTIGGLVTAIALYHYVRIFNSWADAYHIANGVVTATGVDFNSAYRYVDWLLTVPLLLVELVLVMRLTRSETIRKAARLGALAALMVALGYPGEVASDLTTRLVFWGLGMLPFLWIVYELFVGLRSSIERQPESVRGLISSARWLTIAVWAFYPIVYLFPNLGVTGGVALIAVQVGYTISDLLAKAVFGLIIYTIAVRKSEAELASAKA